MQSRISRSFLLFAASGILVACAERQSPFEPLAPRPSTNLVMPPAVLNQVLPISGESDPSRTLPLPTYAEALIVELRIEGLISVESLHESKLGADVDGGGFWSHSKGECNVDVVFSYSIQGFWGPGPCSTTPPQSPRVDTLRVQGQGSVTRDGAVQQWDWECPGVARCWRYQGEQTFSVTPLFAAINLTAPGWVEPAPATIEVPRDTWVTFRVAANPSTFKSINVPIRVISWQWRAASGSSALPEWTGAATDPERRAKIKESGSMVVTAFVNAVEQVDTIKVIVPEVQITLQKNSMKPSERYTRNDLVKVDNPSEQEVRFSVIGANGPQVDKLVTLILTANEGTAGHLSHPGSKPKGNFKSPETGAQLGTAIQRSTGANGVGKVWFVAPDPSGPVTLTAASSGARSDTATIEVGVPGLVELTEGTTYFLIGDKPQHPRNHYATEAHIANLKKLADFFFAKFSGRPTFNDSSLELGGLYDYKSTWAPPHKTHRFGQATDLRTIDRTETQLTALWIAWERFGGTVEDETKDKYGAPAANPHYHLKY
jgi:hypothetical protein